jgi:putative hydrolase of the HAD superfamily
MIKKSLFILFALSSTLAAAPQAVVFDFGGVMTTESDREKVVQFLCASCQLSPKEFAQANRLKHRAIKEGKTDAEFWMQYAKEKKIALPSDWETSLNAVMKESIAANPEMYALVDTLKQKGLPVAMLSNIDDRLAKLIRGFGMYEPFSPCLLSCELGLEKPDSKIYEVLIREMDLPAGDIVFVDDKQENVESARALGIDAILFTSHGQLVQELKQRELL